MFSAFGNGIISALISILRTLVFIVASIMVLPKIWGIYGMWMAIPVAEALTFVLVVPILIIYGRKSIITYNKLSNIVTIKDIFVQNILK